QHQAQPGIRVDQPIVVLVAAHRLSQVVARPGHGHLQRGHPGDGQPLVPALAEEGAAVDDNGLRMYRPRRLGVCTHGAMLLSTYVRTPTTPRLRDIDRKEPEHLITSWL